MSQVSGGQLGLFGPLLDDLIKSVKAPTQFAVVQSFLGDDQGKTGTQGSVVDARAEKHDSPTPPGDSITMALGDSFDQAVQAQSAQVVCHLTGCHVFGGLSQEGSPMVAQVAIGETPGQEMKHHQRAEEGLNRRIGESQTAGPLPTDRDGIIDPAKRVLAQSTILADPLDV